MNDAKLYNFDERHGGLTVTMDINVISFRKEERVSEEGVGGPHGLDRGREKGVNGQRCFQCGPHIGKNLLS